MFYLGIDENGLGFRNAPMMGPLIVTGTGFEIKSYDDLPNIPFEIGNKIEVRNSKKLLKSNIKSYRLLEKTTHSFLSLLGDLIPRNFDKHILEKIRIGDSQYRDQVHFFNSPLNLPVWDSTSNDLIKSLEFELQKRNVRFIFCKSAVLWPKILHQQNKYKKEVEAMGKIIGKWTKAVGEKNSSIHCGKIVNYGDSTIKNWWNESGFSLDSENINFITKGDKKEFPIALSSIIGKYVREIFVYRINKWAKQHVSEIPYCKGYGKRQDKSFETFKEKIIPVCKKQNIPLKYLFRDISEI